MTTTAWEQDEIRHEQARRRDDAVSLHMVVGALSDLNAIWPPREHDEDEFVIAESRLRIATTRLAAEDVVESGTALCETALSRVFKDRSFTGLYDIAQVSVGQYIDNRAKEGLVVSPDQAASDLAQFALGLAEGGLFNTKYGATSAVVHWLEMIAPSTQAGSYSAATAHALAIERRELFRKTVTTAGVLIGLTGWALRQKIRRQA